MENEMVVRQESYLTPAEVVTGATTQAKLLMEIVTQTKCYQEISGKKYLQVEAWETIGAFNRTHAETESVMPILQDGQIAGYLAKVQLWKDGQVVGGASMPCFFTENACRGREGDARHKAAMSAAQTFATSKAYRMNFSYVAILAGYAATPAEEMTGEDSTTPDHTKHGHYCKEHDTQFFKKGKMKGYAHKIEGTDQWCNEPEVTDPIKQPTPTQKLAAAIKEAGYTEENVQSHMMLKYKKAASKDLTPEQLKELTLDVVNCQIAKTPKAENEIEPENY